MIVWHVITPEYPPQIGGVGDYSRCVAEALARAGDEVHVWCPPAARPDASTVTVHHEPGRFRPSDWWRTGRAIDAVPGPRRLLVQWVPHGFGFRSMNLAFCLWLASRAIAGDRVELIVHEPFNELRPGSPRRQAMAVVHRVMTVVLLASASRVWVTIPAWERLLRPFALGRDLRMEWLPVPALVPRREPPFLSGSVSRAAGERPTLGHFGTYGSGVSALLEERLVRIMARERRPNVLLLGRGSEEFHAGLTRRHPEWASLVHATGFVAEDDLPAYVSAVDLFVQPYPDGITTRRTSAMLGLSNARPVLTTTGHLTEPMWRASRAVALVDVGDAATFAATARDLLARPAELDRLGREGLRLCRASFGVERIVTTLRSGEPPDQPELASCELPS